MKRLKIKYNLEDVSYFYRNFGLNFFWVKIEKDLVIQTSYFYECRESFSQVARKYYINKKEKEKICLFNTSVGVILEGKKEATKALYAGKRILNMVEKHYGWPLTKMYLVERKSTEQQYIEYDMAVFKGSSKWLKSVHMISLFTLLIRLGCITALHNCRTFNSLYKVIKFLTLEDLNILNVRERRNPIPKDFYKHINEYFKSAPKNIDEDIDKCIEKLNISGYTPADVSMAYKALSISDILLGKYNNMFRGFTKEHLYGKNAQDLYTEGIYKLATNTSNNVKLSTRLRTMCKYRNISMEINTNG